MSVKRAPSWAGTGEKNAALLQGLVEQQVTGLRDPVAEQGEEAEVKVNLWLAQGEPRQTLGNGGHGGLLRRGVRGEPLLCAYQWLKP